MKMYQFIGTRKKTDFLIYLAYSLTTLGKRVLIVDHTNNEWFKNGYVRLMDDQQLYDLQGIDILCGTRNWLDIEECLRQSGETTTSYDIIMFDIDHENILQQDWPEFDERFYVGDFELDHLKRDAKMLNMIMDKTKNHSFRRITFAAKYRMNPDYIEAFLDEKINWNSINYIFEPDEAQDAMRLTIQHEQTIPYKNLSKEHKELISGLVSELMTVHVEEIKEKQKGRLLGSWFGRKQKVEKKSKDASELVTFEDLK